MLFFKLRYKLLIAWRYFQSKKSNYFSSRISNVTLLIISIMTAIPIITSAIMNGFKESLIEKHIHKDFHIQITYPYAFYNYNKLLEKLYKNISLKKELKGIYPFYENQVLIVSKNGHYFPITLRSIVPQAYLNDHSFQKHFPLIVGHIETKKNFYIAIGNNLAQSLHTTHKNYLQFLHKIKTKNYPLIQILLIPENSPNQKTSPRETIRKQKLLVSGIFKTGYSEYDTHYSFTTLKTGQILFNARIKTQNTYRGQISGIGIKIHNKQNSNLIAQKLQTLFPEYTIYTWKDANKHLLYALEWEKTLMYVILTLMIVTSIIITIYININIIVLEKKQEIGILRACGIHVRTIEHIFLIEGFLIGFIGTTLGILFSTLLLTSLPSLINITENIINNGYSYIYPLKNIQAENKQELFLYKIELIDLWLLSSLAIFVSTLAAYFPARRITKTTITQNLSSDNE